MPRDYHTIILGLGAMGSAAAAHLAPRLPPNSVLGLEQFDIPNNLGSSHGQSRLIRLAYYEHPDYVPLLRRSYELWRSLEQHAATKLLHITGGLYLAPPDHELFAGSLASAKQHNIPHEILTRQQLRKRFPQFTLPKNVAAFFEPEAGVLLPEKAVAAHAALALHHGAHLHAFEPALDWTANRNSVTVRTAHRSYRAKNLIITAGPWTGTILPLLNYKITVTRQSMQWYWPRHHERFLLGRFPAWCAASDAGGLVYGPPMLPDEPAPLGLKVSHHFPGHISDPDSVIRTLLPSDTAITDATLATLLPAAAGRLLARRVCLYSNSPDHHFILDQHPSHKNVLFAAGFSGHGFKFAPVIGQSLADLALTGTSPNPIAFLRLRRLSGH